MRWPVSREIANKKKSSRINVKFQLLMLKNSNGFCVSSVQRTELQNQKQKPNASTNFFETRINVNLLDWLNSWRTQRSKALSHYKKGMTRANKKDYVGAIDYYSNALDTPDIPDDVKGMVLYNRALAYSSIEDDEKAALDLEEMLKISGLPEKVKTAASRRRERIRKRDEKREAQEG